MRDEESFDPRQRRDEVPRQLRVWQLADDHQQGNTVLHHGSQLVRLVADTAVVRDDDPSLPAHRFEPLRVRGVVSKVVGGTFDLQTGGGEDARKLLSEIAVSEKDSVQAARS